MNRPIEDLLRHRADRAEDDPDAERMLDQVRELVEVQRRRRRNLAAAGSGVVVMAAVVTLILLLTPGSSGSTNGRQVGERPAPVSRATSSAASSVTTSPATSPAASARPTSPPAGTSGVTSTSGAVATGRLVKAATTPRRAPLAVRLVPAGWRYLGSVSDATIYGPPGTNKDPNQWAGKLALILGSSNGQAFRRTLTIAGYPARLDKDSALGWNITVRYSSSVLISIYVPTTSNLSRDQVIQLANTLKIRNASSIAHR